MGNAQNIVQGYVAAEALAAYRAPIIDATADFTAKLPTAANQRALGIVDEHGQADAAGDVASVIRHGWAKAEVAAAVAAGDRLNIHGVTGKLKKALSTLTTALTGSNNDLKFTAKVQGREGDLITIEYHDPGGASATAGIEVYGRAIVINLGRATSAINTTADDIQTLIAGHALAASLVTVEEVETNGTGLVTELAATALSGGANDFAQALEAATADGQIIQVQVD